MKKPYGFWSNFKYIWGNVWRYDKNVVAFTVLEVITNGVKNLCGIIIPTSIIMLLEHNVSPKVFSLTVLGIGIVCGAIVAVAVGAHERNYYQYMDVRTDLFIKRMIKRRMCLEYELYEKNSTQEILAKADAAVGCNNHGVEGFMHSSVELMTHIFTVCIYMVILGCMSPLMALIMISISFINYCIYKKVKKCDEYHHEEVAEENVHLNYYSKLGTNTKTGKDIRMYNLQSWIMGNYNKAAHSKKHIENKVNALYLLYDTVGHILQLVRNLLSYGYLIYKVIHGMKLSHFVFYIGIIADLGKSFNELGKSMSITMENHRMVGEFRALEDLENEDMIGSVSYDKNIIADIKFENVSYRYHGSEEYVLKNISFHIKAGEKVALVGINGAGKTTIVKLLCGLYKPSAGKIYVNGIDLSEINKESYWDILSVVFQQNGLTEYSLAENVALSESYDLNRVKEALEKVELWDEVENLCEKEVNLSGGEVQRVMIARALYRQGKVIILDEPTSSLDAISEQKFYRKYYELCKGNTSIYISHRLASTRFCHRILYLDHGSIVESGSHEELMKLKGKYEEMFMAQSKYYEEKKYAH